MQSSFRDPSGFLFFKDGLLYRQINKIYKEHYDHLMSSGIYNRLIKEKLLIPHLEIDGRASGQSEVYKIIQPELIPFVSYPYEWCFSQLKDAALTTLKIQKIVLESGMSLKDASAYNIQFKEGKPLLIDTLSFEKYREGQPWIAYRQFCQHFLAPLALMSLTDVRMSQLFRVHIDGIPLDLASLLLPKKSWLRFSLFCHIHLHSRGQKHFADKQVNIQRHKVSKLSLLGIVENLEKTIQKLEWNPKGTEWANYYENTNYLPEAMEQKKSIMNDYLQRIKPGAVWDIGANTGLFSRLASDKKLFTISFDADPSAVEKNYLECVDKKETHILPLILDLTNPSPAIGWANQERKSFSERGPADMLFALALIHHLAISNNLPFDNIALYFSKLCRYLVIEFVSKNDSKVLKLLSTREDVFKDYTQESFEKSFKMFFSIEASNRLKDSERVLYLMKGL
ncbi:MAG: SAM-dependent methyltransferase [Candidatus Omnitrophica bacterium]|nr:SAM-dependent methyltransferase [Candidatus Omnitrophota bacterium]